MRDDGGGRVKGVTAVSLDSCTGTDTGRDVVGDTEGYRMTDGRFTDSETNLPDVTPG